MQKLISPNCSDFGKPNITIKYFPDTESYVRVPGINKLGGKSVLLYHRLYPGTGKNIFELLLILSIISRKTKQIELFVPYLPYARQDRENNPGEAVSADVLCGLLKQHGVKKLITYDCHFLPRPGKFFRAGLLIENRSAGKELVAYAKKYFGREDFVVVSPDEGSSYFTESAQGLAGHSLRKTRGASKGTRTGIHAEISKIEGEVNVKGKNICILDDIIATGGTIMHASRHLRERGAKKIIVGAVHGVFSGGKIPERILRSSCRHLFTTNSILQNDKHVKVLKLT